MTIYSVIILYTWHVKFLAQGRKPLAYGILLISIALWSFELSGYATYQNKFLSNAYTNYDKLIGTGNNKWATYLKDNNKQSNDFQALLLLGFFNIGTDKIWLGSDTYAWGIEKGAKAGIQLHLPMIDMCLARSSWSIAKKQVKLAAGPFVPKPMLNDLPNDKPFLLLLPEMLSITPDERFLLSCADSIGYFDQCHVYALYPTRIKEIQNKLIDSIKNITQHLNNGDTCILNKGSWFVDHFDRYNTNNAFYGTGAITELSNHDTIVSTITISPLYDNQLYEFSGWFLLSDQNCRSPYFKLEMIDKNNQTIKVQEVLAKENTDNEGLWFRANGFFTLPASCKQIKCRLINDEFNTYSLMDELMLRPSDAVIISKDKNGTLLVNNHKLP